MLSLYREGEAKDTRRMADPLPPFARLRAPDWFLRFCLGVFVVAIVVLFLAQAKFFLIPLAIAILLFSLTGAAIDIIVGLRIDPDDWKLPVTADQIVDRTMQRALDSNPETRGQRIRRSR